MRYARKNLKWDGWGWQGRSFDLEGREDLLLSFLSEQLGLEGPLPETPTRPRASFRPPTPRLADAARHAIAAAIGDTHVHIDDDERVFHAFGRSYRDLLRMRHGTVEHYPDAVVYPGDADEVAAVLRLASEHGFAVVPFGGGSSVVGGVDPLTGRHPAVVTLDTTRLDKVISVDATSHTAVIQAGIYGPELEDQLQARGFTLGHYPQSFEFSTLGGWIAARSSGQQSNRYGSSEKFLVSVRVATPGGELRTVTVPKRAAGPDLNHLIAGSEGVFGVIVDATVKIHDVPETRDYRGVLFPDFETGIAAMRRINQAELPVAMMRLSDVPETYFFGKFASLGKEQNLVKDLFKKGLALKGLDESPCVMLIGFEGSRPTVRFSRTQAMKICWQEGGFPVGPKPGRNWYRGRFEMPYLRDQLMNRGMGVDTLETATSWANIPRLHRVVRDAIRGAIAKRGRECLVLAHISHSYPHGASLYFTFVFERDREDELGQWYEIKQAAGDAIVGNGGTISHHHGVGVDHRPWMARELGPIGARMVEAARAEVDPTGVLNPGKLIPDVSSGAE